MDIRVSQAPMTGDILQAQKPIRPQKEVHGHGFKDIFNEAIRKEQEWANTITAQQKQG